MFIFVHERDLKLKNTPSHHCNLIAFISSKFSSEGSGGGGTEIHLLAVCHLIFDHKVSHSVTEASAPSRGVGALFPPRAIACSPKPLTACHCISISSCTLSQIPMHVTEG